MKKLTSLSMALILAGMATSALAAHNAADGPSASHQSTDVHFSGMVEEATCSLKGKSLKVTLPPANVEDFNGKVDGDVADTVQPQKFSLKVSCPAGGDNSDKFAMTITSPDANSATNILGNSNGTAKGVGLKIYSDQASNGGPLLLGQAMNVDDAAYGLKNAFLNNGDDIPLNVKYVKNGSEQVTSGRITTSAIFELTYR